MDGACYVDFTGDHGGRYYIPCDFVDDFDDTLVFNGSSSFTIYEDINHIGNSLYIQPACRPAYRNSNYNYVYISAPDSVTWNNRSIWYREYDSIVIFCLILLVSLRFMTIFRR